MSNTDGGTELRFDEQEQAEAAIKALDAAETEYDVEILINVKGDTNDPEPAGTASSSGQTNGSDSRDRSLPSINKDTNRHTAMVAVAQDHHEYVTIRNVAAATDLDRGQASTILSNLVQCGAMVKGEVNRDKCRVGYKLSEMMRREFAEYDSLNQETNGHSHS